MDVQEHRVRRDELGDRSERLPRQAVRSVRADADLDQRMVAPPVAHRGDAGELVVDRSELGEVVGLDHRCGDDAAQPDVGGGLGHLVAEEVHLRGRRDPVDEQLARTEAHRARHVVGNEACLAWPHHLEQPAIGRQALAGAAQKQHRRVRVRVHEAGHDEAPERRGRAVERRGGALRAGPHDAVVDDVDHAGRHDG